MFITTTKLKKTKKWLGCKNFLQYNILLHFIDIFSIFFFFWQQKVPPSIALQIWLLPAEMSIVVNHVKAFPLLAAVRCKFIANNCQLASCAKAVISAKNYKV